MSEQPEADRPADLHGRPFPVAVDAEHKATELRFRKCGNPHMRAFHASWFGFFSTFFSTFAPAPLATVLKKPNTLNLTLDQIGNANIVSVATTIVTRLCMGVVCDTLGARKGLAFLLLMTCPGIIGIMCVKESIGFTVCRGIIGCSLASFVACQVWCTQQFSKSVVGAANATAGGWGNLGGGLTNLTMPLFFAMFMAMTSENEDLSWRLSFLIPLILHLASAGLALSGRDLPDGNFKELELSGAKQKSKSGVVTKVGLTNVNAWILTCTYGFCFGIELTMTNIAAMYFQSYFGLSLTLAGPLASIFGLVNIFARSLGGITSDWSARKWGIRGRIWMLWIWSTIQGVLCIVMGLLTIKSQAPFPKIDCSAASIGPPWTCAEPWTKIGGTWTPFNASGMADPAKYLVQHCGTQQVSTDASIRAMLGTSLKQIVLAEPPSSVWAGNGTAPPMGDGCLSNTQLVWPVVAIMFLFSVAVQMAEGLTFGIVPQVSRPALGVVNGMVGAGGNAGSVITLWLYFKGGQMRTDQGIINMGVLICIINALCVFLYFPDEGSMLCGPKGWGKYDPQIIKPPAGYRGADSMDMSSLGAGPKPPAEKKNVPAELGQVQVAVSSG